MEADLVVYDRNGQIVLVTEIKKKQELPLNGRPNGDATCFLKETCPIQSFF